MQSTIQIKLIQIFQKIFLELSACDENQIRSAERESLLSWDSINHLLLVTELEEGFSIQLPDGAAAEVNSFEDASKLIHSLKN